MLDAQPDTIYFQTWSASRHEENAMTEKTKTEEFTISGEKLLGKVREVISEGNVRRIILTNNDGNTLLEVPLTAGIAVTALTAAFAPVLVAVGAIAALVTSVTLTVVRGADPEKADEPIDAEVVSEESAPL